MSRRTIESSPAERPVQFRERDARRIAEAVRAHEAGRRQRKPSYLPRAAGGGGGIVAGFFSGAWPKNGYRTVTLFGEEPPENVIAYNPIVSIPDRGQRRVFLVSVAVETGATTFSTLNFLTCEC